MADKPDEKTPLMVGSTQPGSSQSGSTGAAEGGSGRNSPTGQGGSGKNSPTGQGSSGKMSSTGQGGSGKISLTATSAPPPPPRSGSPGAYAPGSPTSPGSEKPSSMIPGIILLLIVGLAVGFVSGWFGHLMAENAKGEHESTLSTTTREFLFREINAQNIRQNLQRFTSYPHLAGTAGEQRLADDIEAMWKEQGLDQVTQDQYDVLMSYPDPADPSIVELLDASGTVLFQSRINEKNLTSDQNNPDIVAPYNSHSPPGNVTGSLVFVNYGRVEDFQRLRDEYQVNFTGLIAIAKYGKIFRADKVTFAAQFGCVGVILYSDPQDYARGPEAPYPQSWWLPESGVQRGAGLPLKGDPITPGYPATASAYRWREEDVEAFLKIPVHPISYGDASQLLSSMSGPIAPAEWQGGLPINYTIGTSMTQGRSVHLKVTTSNQRANTSNVLGVIRGSVEPDRYVLFGNHRDAWVFGALDPNSGTAVMIEVSRVFSLLLKQGWRPRRTIIFCSWGSEEPGLFGSTEFVEHFVKNLGNRAVVYINMDGAVKGNSTFTPGSAPILQQALYDLARELSAPNNPNESLYDEWMAVNPNPVSGKPKINGLGGGSDHLPFIAVAGVSAVDLQYSYDPALGLSSTPCYHSAYETFFLFDNYIDPDYKYCHTMAEVAVELVRQFADTPLLSSLVNVTLYHGSLMDFTDQLQTARGDLLQQNGVGMDTLREAVALYGTKAAEFETCLQQVDLSDTLRVRGLNDQMMQVERAFLDPNGVPQQSSYKHLLAAPSKFNSYSGGASFPGLDNLLFDVESMGNQTRRAHRWEEIRKHLATLIFTIESAAGSLDCASGI